MKNARGKWLELLIVLIIHVALLGCSTPARRIDVEIKNSLAFDIVIRADLGPPLGERDYTIKAGVTMKYNIPAGMRPSKIRIEVKK